jgi:hypothetical protein
MPPSWEQRSSLEDFLVPKVTVNKERFLIHLFQSSKTNGCVNLIGAP